MRAVDVDDVERDGHAGGSTGFGHELIGNQVWGHLVENPCDLDCHWSLSAQLPRRLKRHRRDLPNLRFWVAL